MTKLENLVLSHSKYKALGENTDKKERQSVLDEIAEEVLAKLSSREICDHVREVYDATVDEYVKNPHSQGVIDELIEFMNMLPDGTEVLDIGCGTGRDVFFMSVNDADFRRVRMQRVSDGKTTLEKLPVPSAVFKAVGVDSSEKMLRSARAKKDELIKNGVLPEFSYADPFPHFIWADMHNIDVVELGHYDAIWSCTALFTHTPRSLIEPAMQSVATVLKSGGILFLSYTNGQTETKYDKLLFSSTGRIKYFSQPDPAIIWFAAKKYGLELEKESFSDFEVNGALIKKGLFVSQFFRKA